ncbi:hypothetical protein GGR50DRAFT_649859 [Xylaria sp. CBS 124048]|nr:hypothetical protein GGR50DRAFT_649859 [Xylaria sp. CBS 124048]
MEAPISDPTGLPYDLFLLIIGHLTAEEIIECQRLSRAWNFALTNGVVTRSLLRWHFPRVWEMRNALREEQEEQEEGEGDHTTANLERVYQHVYHRHQRLRTAEPKRVEKIRNATAATAKRDDDAHASFREVEPWDRRLEFGGGENEENITNDNNNNINYTTVSTAPFQYGNTDWSLDDGLLVYRHSRSRYVVRDLETNYREYIPFNVLKKTVRRLRLAEGVLVFEWCRIPCAVICAHFATAFDICRRRGRRFVVADRGTPFFHIRQRHEWLIHAHIGPRDRFFSAHTAKYYALYLWQQDGNRPVEDDDTREQLMVWDITATSSSSSPLYNRRRSYVPGVNDDDDEEEAVHDTPQPQMLKIFKASDLAFLEILQGHEPTLREIYLDATSIYVHEEDHHWLTGVHVPPATSLIPRPSLHEVRATGFPLSGIGPRWFDKCSADGDEERSFCPRAGSARRLRRRGVSLWPGWAPCWRHEDLPNVTVSEVVDKEAGVRIAARRCFEDTSLVSYVRRPESGEDEEKDEGEEEEEFFDEELWDQLLGKGMIAGDERWVVGEDRKGEITVVRF